MTQEKIEAYKIILYQVTTFNAGGMLEAHEIFFKKTII